MSTIILPAASWQGNSDTEEGAHFICNNDGARRTISLCATLYARMNDQKLQKKWQKREVYANYLF
jgi:hypothetical protein